MEQEEEQEFVPATPVTVAQVPRTPCSHGLFHRSEVEDFSAVSADCRSSGGPSKRRRKIWRRCEERSSRVGQEEERRAWRRRSRWSTVAPHSVWTG